MANKPNPFLAKLEAQKEAEHQQRRRALSEIHIMAMLIAAHNKLKVGSGRAPGLLVEYVRVKEQIAKDIADDIGDSRKKNGNGDREFLHTKKDLALTLMDILGPENWRHYQEFFPLLRDYWEG